MSKKQRQAPKKAPPQKPRGASEQKRESEDIERAVYDGMQDLRVKKKPGRA